MYRIKWLIILSMILTMNACVESKKNLEEYVNKIKKTAKGKVEPIPPPKEIKGETYTAETVRSPFVLMGGKYVPPQILTGPGGEAIQQQPRPDLDRPREYLEQFPLTNLSMVGTLSKPQMNWGLVKDGNGLIHAVKIGDYMGQNSGQIIAITPDQIKLNEVVPNGTGGWMQSRAALMLVPAPEQEVSQPDAKKAVSDKTQTPQPKQPTPVQRQPQQQPQSQQGQNVEQPQGRGGR